MAERTEQLTRDRDDSEASSGGVRSRIGAGVRARVGRPVRSRFGGLFSVRAFLASLLVLTAGLLAGGTIVPAIPLVGGLLGPLGGLLGLLAGGFAVGLGGGRTTEAGAAGALVAALSLLLSMSMLSVVLGFGVPVAVVGGGSGLLVAALGTYFGGDLRDGLTKEL